MADLKISELALATPDTNDVIPFVDISDTSMGLSGTTKKATKADLKGDKGDDASITIGSVTKLASDTTPTVENVGTAQDAIFNFGIPKGSVIYSTVIIPDNSIGMNGDWAFSTSSTSNVWYKSGGVWNLVNSNKGAKGDTGAKIVSAAFSGNNIVFTLDDATTVVLTDAKLDLKGDTGDTGAKIVSAAFVGNDIVFTLDDASTTTLTGAKITLKGDKGDTGDIGINWLGAYDNAHAYVLNDGVSYNGSSYINIQAGTGHLPTDASYWSLIAAKGADGSGAGDVSSDTTSTTTSDVAVYSDTSGKLITKLSLIANSLLGKIAGGLVAVGIDSDLSSVSANDDTVPSAKATKAMGDLKAPLRPVTEKTVLVDADETTGNDSANTFSQIRTTWTNVKSFLKTYFDTLYQAIETTKLLYSRNVVVKAASTATLTLSGTQTIDGIACAAGDLVLAKNQATASQNGIYVVAAGAWARAAEYNETLELDKYEIFVLSGTVNAKTWWLCATKNATVDSTALVIAQIPNGIGTGADQAMAGNTAALLKSGGATGGAMTGALNEAKGADIASSGSIDIGAGTGNFIDITGTTTITALGTVQAGTRRVLRFTGALILTHHATALILPTGASITTAAGDTAEMLSLGSGNWVCVLYQRKDGTALVGGGKTYGTAASSATPAINTNLYDRYELTAQAVNITSMSSSLTGTPVKGDPLNIKIVPSASATPATVGSATEGEAYGGTTVSVNKPTGVADGDLMFAWAVQQSNALMTAPAGWNTAGSNMTDGSDGYVLFWRIAASEGASYSFGGANNVYKRVDMMAIRGGFNASSPIQVVSNTAYTTSDTTIRAASMTLTAGAAVFLFSAMGAGVAMSTTPPSGYTEFMDIGANGNWWGNSIAYNLSVAPGATGNKDFVSTATKTQKHAIGIALNPPSLTIAYGASFSNVDYVAPTTIYGTVILDFVWNGTTWETHGKSEYLTGTAAPTTIPTKAGMFFIDTTNSKLYVSKNVTASTDWFILN